MTSQNSDGIWVAGPGQLLDRAQRDSNKTKNKIARHETLAGPFAAGTAGQAAQANVVGQLMARIAALEEAASKARMAAGLTG